MIIQENTMEQVSNACDVAKLLQAILTTENPFDQEKEHFWVIGVTVRNTIKFVDLVSLGTLNASLIHPRETFRLAILKGVASIICGHNHPSNDPSPSRDDLIITERLKAAGEILGIKVLDHIILGNAGEHISLLEKGYL